MEQLKKYKLQDLVANGSYARRKVDSDLLVGDTSAGYGYGDILDANATAQLMKEKLEDLNIDDINQAVIDNVAELKRKDIEHDNQITTLKTTVNNRSMEVRGDNLVVSF